MPSEQTEEATPRKLAKARARGRVWRSRDLSSAMILLAAIGVFFWVGGAIFERLRWLMATMVRQACAAEPPPPQLVLDVAFDTIASCLWPLLGAVVVTATVAGFVQVGPLLAAEPLKPKLKRLDPFSGLKRLFDGRGSVQALSATGKVVVLGGILALTLAEELQTLISTVHAGPAAGPAAVATIAGKLALRGGAVLLGLALIDVVYQRYRYRKDLRMTRREVEDERRETEGDLSQKGERRRLHAELLERAMVEQVREAAVVIVDSQRFAAALSYDPESERAPSVLACGRGVIALKITAVARRQGVAVVQDPSLAQSLVDLEAGEQIPEERHEVVAAILRGVTEHVERG